jgi:hypothetical protein
VSVFLFFVCLGVTSSWCERLGLINKYRALPRHSASSSSLPAPSPPVFSTSPRSGWFRSQNPAKLNFVFPLHFLSLIALSLHCLTGRCDRPRRVCSSPWALIVSVSFDFSLLKLHEKVSPDQEVPSGNFILVSAGQISVLLSMESRLRAMSWRCVSLSITHHGMLVPTSNSHHFRNRFFLNSVLTSQQRRLKLVALAARTRSARTRRSRSPKVNFASAAGSIAAISSPGTGDTGELCIEINLHIVF